jgi:hypothetical protein
MRRVLAAALLASALAAPFAAHVGAQGDADLDTLASMTTGGT